MQASIEHPEDVRLERALVRIGRRIIARPMRALGNRVDKAGYLTLGYLESCGRTRMSDLAGLLEVDISTVSRQVRVLEELELVSRVPDPEDRRACLLDLTRGGRRELAVQRRQRFALLDAAMAPWPAKDRERLMLLLERLADDLDAPTTAPLTREARS